jgi:hypothetical protein
MFSNRSERRVHGGRPRPTGAVVPRKKKMFSRKLLCHVIRFTHKIYVGVANKSTKMSGFGLRIKSATSGTSGSRTADMYFATFGAGPVRHVWVTGRCQHVGDANLQSSRQRISLEVVSIHSMSSLKVVPADVSLIRRYCFHRKTPHNVLLNHYVLVQTLLGSGSWESAVGVPKGYSWTPEGLEFESLWRQESFSSPHLPNWFCGPPSLLSDMCRGCFLEGKTAGAWSWSLTFK